MADAATEHGFLAIRYVYHGTLDPVYENVQPRAENFFSGLGWKPRPVSRKSR